MAAGRPPIRWLERLIDLERTPGRAASLRVDLRPVRALLDRAGHPERDLRILHVAGSKGKGSVALLAEAVLRAGGHRVGTFTSPHLERWTERFRVDGTPVSEGELEGTLEVLRPAVEALREDDRQPTPTWFDVTTTAAFLLFRGAGVDYAVIEVGLGGRLDSTNAARARVACITSIELEHTDRLGDTLAAIAREKAGILEAGRPVVVGALAAEALDVVEARARELGAPVVRFGRDLRVEPLPGPVHPCSAQRFRIRDAGGAGAPGPLEVEAELPVAGAHQTVNAALAVAAARRLPGYADRLGTDGEALAHARGLGRAVLPGRVEVVGRKPLRLVDSAHTPASARALASVLEGLPRKDLRLVLSVSAGKQIDALLGLLVPGATEVFTTRAEPLRSLPSGELAARVRGRFAGVPVIAEDDPRRCLAAALGRSGPRDLLVAAGSVYLAGIARRVLRADAPAGRP